MKISRNIGKTKVSVKDWSSDVEVKDIKTGKIVSKITFSNHLQAILAVKAL